MLVYRSASRAEQSIALEHSKRFDKICTLWMKVYVSSFSSSFLNRIQGICHLLRSHNSTQLPLSI